MRRQKAHLVSLCIVSLCSLCNPPDTGRSPSGSRTRDSGAGGGRSNKERQRLQPLASVARAPLLRSGERGLHTALTGIHPLHLHK